MTFRTVARAAMSVLAIVLAVAFRAPSSAQDQSNTLAVTVEESESAFTLKNGIVIARVSKRTGDLTSLAYMGQETLTDRSGHAGGYWSHDTTGGKETIARVTIDPRANGGARSEVSVK